MTLFRSYRRWWSLVVFAVLCLPMLVQPFADGADANEEQRTPAPRPAMPDSLAAWEGLPGAIDAFLDDHFGGRSTLVGLYGRLRHALRSPSSERVVYGRDGWLFLADRQVLEQASGRLLRHAAVAALVDDLAEMDQRLRAQDRRLFAAIMPNKHSIYRDQLPTWLQRPAVDTEYDDFLQSMREHGLATVDLRSPLLAAPRTEPVYQKTDTHWNRLGALLAYNAIVTAAGRPQWVLAPGAALGGWAEKTGGDLARFLGISRQLADQDRRLLLPDPLDLTTASGHPAHGDYDVPGAGDGGTVLVIGDSFSRNWLRPYLAQRASRLVWIHHRGCRFDWSAIERYRPDLVLFLMVERSIATCRGNRPENMPR